MSESKNTFRPLTVSQDRAGTTVTVYSTANNVFGSVEIAAYVDDDGTVRQQANDGAFNAQNYTVK
jgi:hypothetical protein